MDMTVATPALLPASAVTPEDAARNAMARYQQAYWVARTLATVGEVFYWAAKLIVFGAVFGVINFAFNDFNLRWLLVCLVGGVIAGALPFLAGVLVAASGQMLKALLDTAVHSSPFLNDDQRAEAMSLCKPPQPAEAEEDGWTR